MSLSTKEDIQSLMANYRDVEMEKERAFIVNGNSPMETEPPVHSPSMSSPLASHISNSILDSHTPPNPSAESPSSHSDESSPDVSMSLENAPSSSAIPPPLSDVRILNRINHRAIPPRLFVATNTFTFSNTPLLYTHKPPSSSSSSSIHNLLSLLYQIRIAPRLPKQLPAQRQRRHSQHQHRHPVIEVRPQQRNRFHFPQQFRQRDLAVKRIGELRSHRIRSNLPAAG